LETHGIERGKLILQSLKQQEEAAVAYNKGLVLVASHLSSINALELCRKHNLQAFKCAYGTYTPYQPSQEKLRVSLQALLMTASKLVHDDGSKKTIR